MKNILENTVRRLGPFVPQISRLRATITDQGERIARLEERLAEPQAARETAQESEPPAPAPAADHAPGHDAYLRLMQEYAVAACPLLPYEWFIRDGVFLARGIAYSRTRSQQLAAFFVNGQRAGTVTYPVKGEDPGRPMALLSGHEMSAFEVSCRLSDVPASPDGFLRLDFAPDGVFRASDHASAWFFLDPAQEPVTPGEDARRRVIGDVYLPSFLLGGATIFKRTQLYLRDVFGKDIGACGPILDWGCGSGRLTRYLAGFSDAEVQGVDIDADNVEWCRENLTRGRFSKIPLSPPMDLPDDHFGLAFGVSVFTHLTLDQQSAWLAEIERVLKPGGLFFASLAGPAYFSYSKVPYEIVASLEENGFYDHGVDPALAGYIEDEAYYRSVFVSRNFVVDRWEKSFEVLDIVDGMASTQDFIVLRKRG